MASSFSDTALRLLPSCAEAIEDGDLKSAEELLQKILILVDERPYSSQSRVVKYFADALVRRPYGLHPASSYLTFPVDPAPYYHYNRYHINGVIKKVIDDALMGNRRLHLIDFSIPYYWFQNSVLRTLPNFFGNPLPVRVSYILPPFLKKYVQLSGQMKFLTKDAKEVNVMLEDELKVVYGNSLAEVDECEIDLKRRRDDEMVVVYYKFKLDKLGRDAKAMERELVRLKEINPTIVIMLDFYSNHSDSNFLTCFKDSFQYSLKTLDYWAELGHFQWKYERECNREAGEGNNIIRRYPSLTEWQHLFSMAGFSRIPLNHNKDNLGVEDDIFLEIMGEEEECLILGYEGCRMFFLSAWKPKVEDGHFNPNSTNHKFGQGFKPNPLTRQPLQPFLEGLILNRLAVFAEIHDISKDLCCKYKLSLALTWASKVNNMNETISDPNKKHAFSIQSNSCYAKDRKSFRLVSPYMISRLIEKAFESRDGYHFEPSLTKVEYFRRSTLKACNIDAVAICLQNRHTSDEVYIVQFYWPPTESEISKSLALRIFNDLKHMKTTFVIVKVQGPEIKFQEEDISSIPTSSNTAMPLKIAENAHIEQIVETKRNKQRKSWSKVWVDFDKFEEHGKQVAKCKHCLKVFTGSSKSGTTHLNNHSKVCPGKKKQNQESQLILPVDTNERSSTFDQERSHLDLVKMVIRHQYPLDLAGQEAFKNFVKGLQPMYEFQSRDKLLSDIHRIYNEERKKLQLYFDQLACKLNLTVSLWKNNHAKTAYCCLIAHFIDDGWELKMKILGLRKLEHVYDTKVVAGIIRSFVSEWNISKKVCSITVDNSFLNDGMVHQIRENCVSEQGSLSSAHWFISFTLFEDGFREMDSILSKLWKSIEYVTETTHGKLNFQEAVNQVKLQGGKSWDELSFKLESDSDILDSALRSRAIFCKLEQIDDNFMLNLSKEEWEKAVTLQSCFKCFDDIKGTQSLTANLYFPKLCNMYEEFGQLKKSNHPFVILMKRKFDNYWSLCNVVFTIAAALDPRLKFRFPCNVNDLESMMKLTRLRKVLMDVYFEYANEAKSLSASSSVLDDSNSLTAETTKDCTVSYFSKFASASNVKEVASQKSVLDCYLEETLLPSDADILGWWRVNSQRFPALAKMARDFLAIPVSVSSPCSNIRAMTINPAYSSLGPESMEALVCSQNWLESTKESAFWSESSLITSSSLPSDGVDLKTKPEEVSSSPSYISPTAGHEIELISFEEEEEEEEETIPSLPPEISKTVLNEIEEISSSHETESETSLPAASQIPESLKTVNQSVEPPIEVGAFISSQREISLDRLSVASWEEEILLPDEVETEGLSQTDTKANVKRTVLKILELLSNVTVRRIGVYGIGRVGKTTVLKAFIDHPQINDMFDLIIWVTVSKYWSIRKLQDEVLRQLSTDFRAESENREELFRYLERRKFLLVLDDVWESIDLEAVGIPDPSSVNGSAIILATRNLEVCDNMRFINMIEVGTFSNEEAWKLFCEQVGRVVNIPGILPFARVIAERCGGLPLLVIVTGRALSGEEDVFAWEQAFKQFSGPCGDLRSRNDIIQLLKFSFDRLEVHDIQSCFLHCALFPEDQEVNISEFVTYCIEEGLIAGNTADAYKRSHEIITALVRAFLLETTSNSSIIMHDMIRDLALAILLQEKGSQFLLRAYSKPVSRENHSSLVLRESPENNRLLIPDGCQFILKAGSRLTQPPSVEEWGKSSMIFLMDNNLSALPESPSCPGLLTLFLQRNFRLRVIPMSFFDCMPCLKVLNLSNTRIKSLPRTISKLVSLETLILRHCERLSMLPSDIGSLKLLQVLDLRGTEISLLPDEIGELSYLTYFDICFYGSINRREHLKLPQGLISSGIISRLCALQSLGIRVCPGDERWDKCVKSIIYEVSKLTGLTPLSFYFPEVELLELFLQKSAAWIGQCLTEYNFVVGHDIKRIVSRVPQYVELDYDRTSQRLRFVNGEKIPDAIVKVLADCSAFYLDHHLDVISISKFGIANMNKLKHCIVSECPTVKAVLEDKEFTEVVFPCLEHLNLHYLWNLEYICNGLLPEGSFAMLRILYVHACPKLKYVLKSSMLRFFSKLEELIVDDCTAIEKIILDDDMTPDLSHMSGSSFKRLTLHYLPALETIREGVWPSFEYISVYNCPNFKKINLDSKSKNTLKGIKGEEDWWDSLEWKEPSLSIHFNDLITLVSEDDI